MSSARNGLIKSRIIKIQVKEFVTVENGTGEKRNFAGRRLK